MHPHDRWLELAALDEIGELTAEEADALRAHLRECAACRASATAMADVVHEWLPLAARAEPAGRAAGDAAVERAAFLARARSEGLRFSQAAMAGRGGGAWWSAWTMRRGPAPAWAAAAAVVLLLGWALGGRGVVRSSTGQSAPQVAPEVAIAGGGLVDDAATRLMGENATLREALDLLRHELDAVRAQAAALRVEVSAARERSRLLERALEATRDEAARGQLQLLRAQGEVEEATARLTASQEQLVTLQGEVERLSAQYAADRDLFESRAYEVEDLRRQVRAQTARADRAYELLAADRDIRDLMGARNLHIVDVRDTDARGRTRKAFGRLFYTEGKSLIFYAYDLEPSRPQNAAFQVWGARTGQEDRAVSLGLLYSDDHGQSRWMMKFDDPKVLREIDSVFVTVERPGGSDTPSNRRMLYAYLLNEPNHR